MSLVELTQGAGQAADPATFGWRQGLRYSALGVLHQAWGARLGGGAPTQSRIVSWREALSLAGVLAASVLPALAGMAVMVASGVVLLALGLWALSTAPFRARRHPAGSCRPLRSPSAPGRCPGACRVFAR